jgi:Icc-related predicted phosphoesterase
MKLVMISDTHTMHSKVVVPEGDVLVHAGDMALSGSVREVQSCLNWLNNQPHKHVIAIAGNHDWAFERPHMKSELELGRIHYLENSGITIDGKTFYGSPVQPEFCNWAFNVARGPAIKRYWDAIPDVVDVLITHGPPMGVLDYQHPKWGNAALGCEELRLRVDVVAPAIHVFGHIHGGYGTKILGKTQFFNASIVNEAYKVVNPPWVVEI